MKRLERMDALQQRRLAIGLLIAVIVVVLSSTVLPVAMAHKSYNDEIASLSERLYRVQGIASQDEMMRDRYVQLQRAQAARGYFLQGDSAAVASADLQRLLKEITARNETQLMSTQILPAQQEGSLTRVSLRVRITGPLQGLYQSLYDVEANPVLMFVDNASVRTAAVMRQRLRPNQSSDMFEATFDLSAYVTGVE